MRAMLGLLSAAAALGLTLGAGSAARASILTFDGDICGGGTSCSNFEAIDQSYGDTAGVDVQYNRDVLNLGYTTGAAGSEMEWWQDDYNDLHNVAFGGANDSVGRPMIFLAPLTALPVVLNGFDLGAFSHAVRETQFDIVDGLGNILYSSPTLTIGTGDVHNHFNINLSSTTGIGVQFGPNGYNVGIDNLRFNEPIGGPVPEPASWALMILGFGLAGAALRRRGLATA